MDNHKVLRHDLHTNQSSTVKALADKGLNTQTDTDQIVHQCTTLANPIDVCSRLSVRTDTYSFQTFAFYKQEKTDNYKLNNEYHLPTEAKATR